MVSAGSSTEQSFSINPFTKIGAKPRPIKSRSDFIWVFHFASVFGIADS
jgi:hypothetical protein